MMRYWVDEDDLLKGYSCPCGARACPGLLGGLRFLDLKEATHDGWSAGDVPQDRSWWIIPCLTT